MRFVRLVHVLASGVFFSGFVKDLLCLPRPLSPPLQRISMSHSASLEYGFPSTHSTNAVSVAVYFLSYLNSSRSTVSDRESLAFHVLVYLYVSSIVLGRLYCGMHGLLDIVVGSSLGALISLGQILYGQAFNDYILLGTAKDVIGVALVILLLVRIHPEPADDCPCFDDSVSFAGVFLGQTLAHNHCARLSSSWNLAYPDTSPYRLQYMGWPKTVLRILIGVLAIFVWRQVTKPFLLQILPPVYRGLEKLGLIIPRRFFTRAS